MAGFQLAGPAANVFKISTTLLTRAAIKARNWARTDSMKNILHHDGGMGDRGGKNILYCAFGLWYDLRFSPYKMLDISAAGPASSLQAAQSSAEARQKNGRSIGHLADFDRQLKAAGASIEKHCDGHKNALLALSVKQVHAGKLTINRLAALRVPPLKYVTDKELYVRELDEACTSYYKEFLEHSGPKATRQ
jgi:hypothetical protein